MKTECVQQSQIISLSKVLKNIRRTERTIALSRIFRFLNKSACPELLLKVHDMMSGKRILIVNPGACLIFITKSIFCKSHRSFFLRTNDSFSFHNFFVHPVKPLVLTYFLLASKLVKVIRNLNQSFIFLLSYQFNRSFQEYLFPFRHSVDRVHKCASICRHSCNLAIPTFRYITR